MANPIPLLWRMPHESSEERGTVSPCSDISGSLNTLYVKLVPCLDGAEADPRSAELVPSELTSLADLPVHYSATQM